MAENEKCPIWGTSAQLSSDRRGGYRVDSPRADGQYYISREAKINLRTVSDEVRARLTTWLINQRLLGMEQPSILDTTIEEIKSAKPLSISERADRLLRFLAKECPELGGSFRFYPEKSPNDQSKNFGILAWTESVNISAVISLAQYCEELGWVKLIEAKRIQGFGIEFYNLSMKPQGYMRLEEIDKKSSNAKQAFVAMWFDPEVNEVYEKAIDPAIRQAGYVPLRIDKKDHNNRIDDEIIAEIRRSRFVVADFTHGDKGMRGGVYYEAGFAYGLNLQVIFTCRKDKIGEVHFDTRQYNHIVWTDDKLDEFRKALANRISATIGDGPGKTNLDRQKD